MFGNGASTSSGQAAVAGLSNENHIKDSNGLMLSTANGRGGNPVTTLKRNRRRSVSRLRKRRGSKRRRRGGVSSRRQKRSARAGRRSRSKRRQLKSGRRRDDEDRSSLNSDDEENSSEDTETDGTSNDDGRSMVSNTDHENGDGCGKRSCRIKKSGCGNKRRRKKSSCARRSRRRRRQRRGCSRKKSKPRCSRPRTCYDGNITDISTSSDEIAATASSKPKASRGTRSKCVHHCLRDEDYTDTD